MIRTAIAITLASALASISPASADNTGGETASAAPVAAGAPAPWQPEAGDTIHFDVLRKGKPFGTHIVRFSDLEDGGFKATTDVDLKAGLGPLVLFRYSLDSTEVWQGGKLVSLTGETNDDGTRERVEADMSGDMLQVSGSAYQGEAPAGIIPSSHWNIHEAYSSRLLSTESGELLDTEVTRIGRETIKAGGEEIEATHYRLKSDITVDLWYDDQGRWVKLGFEARGQQIDYVLKDLY